LDPASRNDHTPAPAVLVIDDVADNRELYAEFLAFAGLRVVTAADAERGLAEAFATRPSVIIMDLGLPLMDGWEATRILKADPRTRGTPLVVVTGYIEEEMLRRARDAGADAVLTKPCIPTELLARVMSFMPPPSPADAFPPEKTATRRKRLG
jgi:two-component system cell cycle response regulator DivK